MRRWGDWWWQGAAIIGCRRGIHEWRGDIPGIQAGIGKVHGIGGSQDIQDIIFINGLTEQRRKKEEQRDPVHFAAEKDE